MKLRWRKSHATSLMCGFFKHFGGYLSPSVLADHLADLALPYLTSRLPDLARAIDATPSGGTLCVGGKTWVKSARTWKMQGEETTWRPVTPRELYGIAEAHASGARFWAGCKYDEETGPYWEAGWFDDIEEGPVVEIEWRLGKSPRWRTNASARRM